MNIHYNKNKRMRMKILIINGHPRKDSLNFALADAYKKGAENSGAVVKTIDIIDLKFIEFGTIFRDFEPVEDIKMAQELILWADHIVWVYHLVVHFTGINEGFHGTNFSFGLCFQVSKK